MKKTPEAPPEDVRLAQELEEVSARKEQLERENERLMRVAVEAKQEAEAAQIRVEELTRSCERDSLTDTPNRTLMLDRLNGAIALAKRQSTRFALMFLDLDNLKAINDAQGHAIGDEALKLVARRLEGLVRESDTVSRHGGDEFLVLLADVDLPMNVSMIASKMIETLGEPGHFESCVLNLSVSIGVAIYPEDGADAQTLIDLADAAMYRSKRRSPGGYEFHNSDG